MEFAILVFLASPVILILSLCIGETLLESLLASVCVPFVIFLVVWGINSIAHQFGAGIDLHPKTQETQTVEPLEKTEPSKAMPT